VLSTDVVVLDQNEAIAILVILAEFNVFPLQCNELPTPKAGSDYQKENRIILLVDALGGAQKFINLFRSQPAFLNSGIGEPCVLGSNSEVQRFE